MPRYNLHYAFDIPYYADFSIEAETPEAALLLAEKLLEDGAFGSVMGDPCYENECEHRVFGLGDGDTPATPENVAEDVSELHGIDKEILAAVLSDPPVSTTPKN